LNADTRESEKAFKYGFAVPVRGKSLTCRSDSPDFQVSDLN
jgi:hypothetical protein